MHQSLQRCPQEKNFRFNIQQVRCLQLAKTLLGQEHAKTLIASAPPDGNEQGFPGAGRKDAVPDPVFGV